MGVYDVKIVTWNLQHGSVPRPQATFDDQFAYLCNELKPDLAFLQETYNPAAADEGQGEPRPVFHSCMDKNGKLMPWGSAI